MGLLQTCAELGTAMVAFSPVGRSLLTDTPLSHAAVQDLAFLVNNPRFMEPNYTANIAAIAPFQALAAQMGMSAAGLAIAWVMAQGDHVIPIPGTRSVTHFTQLLEAAGRALFSGAMEWSGKVLLRRRTGRNHQVLKKGNKLHRRIQRQNLRDELIRAHHDQRPLRPVNAAMIKDVGSVL